jgi:hypothetical protein
VFCRGECGSKNDTTAADFGLENDKIEFPTKTLNFEKLNGIHFTFRRVSQNNSTATRRPIPRGMNNFIPLAHTGYHIGFGREGLVLKFQKTPVKG